MIEDLKKVLRYDPNTGHFWWLVRLSSRCDMTKPAGTTRHDGYRIIRVFGTLYLAHRLAWFFVNGDWPEGLLDHANGDKGDNSIANLRLATGSQNNANARVRSDNSSGFKGVSFNKLAGKWMAYINQHGRREYLGLFGTAEAAADAYRAAANQKFGDFARAA